MRSLDSIRALVAQCVYPGFEFKVGGDAEPWLQVVCPDGVDTASGEPSAWRGRKWRLAFHMTDTEIVQTVWAAVQRAILHEASELFRFKDAAIFNRHISVHRLAEIASEPGIQDGREEPEAPAVAFHSSEGFRARQTPARIEIGEGFVA